MYPAYYPHHTNPIHYATSNDPRPKEIDRGTLNLPYHPFPYASNHCYPIPQPCHPCCNHSYFGGPYTFTSPYPHYPPPPPPPYPTHGFYPPFTGAHPGYSFPPPHYSIEQPRYDYDKNTPTPHHCSSCEKKSNIEQEESKVDKKTTTDSLVPFLNPIVWVPPNYMNTEPNTKEKDNHPRVHVSKPLEPTLKQRGNDEIAQGQQGEVDKRFPFPIFWLPSNEVKKDIKGDNVDEMTRNDSEVESEKSSSIKHGVQKVIPVKQLEAKEEKKSEKDKEKKVTEKTSKLPPVCLRIDPLPKKKNTSRSPSPPGEKERSKRSTIEDSKSFKQQTELPESVKNDEKKAEKDSVVDVCNEKGVEQDRLSEVEGLKVEKKKRSLSENEAAVMIQSVYRGFEARKSQPLMKLRKIAEVGKQVVELRNRIQDLELSSSAINDKQKLIIGEIIMSLLLKLDTIQGLHPIVRDIRKSVAKELVGLQEKLDSLTSVKPETTSEETACSTDRVEDDAIHEKSDESQPKSDSNIAKHVENRQVEATESTQYDDYDAQVELQNEENINDNQIPTLVEPEQTADDSIGHEKAQSDSNDGSVRLDLENHEFEATDPMKTEQLITGEVNEEQVQVAVETDQTPETSEQPQSESGTSFEAMESDQTQALIFKDVDSIEDLTATTVEVEKDVTTAETAESGKEDEAIEDQVPILSAEEAPTVVDVDQTTATAETRELGEEDEAIGVQEPDVSTEEAPTVEVDDLTTATVEVEKDVSAAETNELRKEDDVIGVKDESIVANEAAPVVDEVDGGSMEEVGGDRRLMDENEKLRAAVEELMKAGNEQVSVIRELTGRVKDLEKKLSKKKTRKLKKCRGSRASVVEEELRSCVV